MRQLAACEEPQRMPSDNDPVTRAEFNAAIAQILERMEAGDQRLMERMEAGDQRLMERMEAGELRLAERLDRAATAILRGFHDWARSSDARAAHVELTSGPRTNA